MLSRSFNIINVPVTSPLSLTLSYQRNLQLNYNLMLVSSHQEQAQDPTPIESKRRNDPVVAIAGTLPADGIVVLKRVISFQ